MSRNGKVIVAMSGGVDSSVAACLLKEQGYDCIGVFMRVGAAAEDEACALEAADAPAPAAPRRLKHGCCSTTDALDARMIASKLGIPFYVLNFKPDFESIIDYFVDEYRRARTPNPCVMCNIQLKFGKLLRYAEAMEAEFIATGHYARIVRVGESAAESAAPRGTARLARGAHVPKDQSYVLFGIRREYLSRCLFPIGHIPDKATVRAMAADLGLRVHDKPDSQEICFVPNNDYRALIRARVPEALRPGEFRDLSGQRVGTHAGVAAYTIGQRRGLGLAVGLPVYVTQIDPRTNTVTVGEAADLLAGGLVAGAVNWLVDPPPIDLPLRVTAKIRHMHTPTPARLWRRHDETIELRFDDAQSAVTPGQAAVFYDQDIVLGGGWIDQALPIDAP